MYYSCNKAKCANVSKNQVKGQFSSSKTRRECNTKMNLKKHALNIWLLHAFKPHFLNSRRSYWLLFMTVLNFVQNYFRLLYVSGVFESISLGNRLFFSSSGENHERETPVFYVPR
jgi:hypothetical protein